MNELQRRMIEALIDTCERTTDLENVYNDKMNPSEHFEWEELKAELRKPDQKSEVESKVDQAVEILTMWLVDHGTGSEDEDADDPANYFENIDPEIDNARSLLQEAQELLG